MVNSRSTVSPFRIAFLTTKGDQRILIITYKNNGLNFANSCFLARIALIYLFMYYWRVHYD